MLIRQDNDFFIEHGENRRGYFNSRMHITDAGSKDKHRSKVYDAEQCAENAFSLPLSHIHCPNKNYYVAGVIDSIVTQDDYVKWFGGTHLLVMFSRSRGRSRAMRECIEFADNISCGVPWFDIYHELAHSVTISDDEPHHGERFIAAFIMIASLSPVKAHGNELAKQFRKVGLYPTAKYFLQESYV